MNAKWKMKIFNISTKCRFKTRQPGLEGQGYVLIVDALK
ncbi:hypothetical protein V6Z11_D05G412600 [Gossypium hirsutum]